MERSRRSEEPTASMMASGLEVGGLPTPPQPPDPCAVVIFGASGDLTRRELVPALYELARRDLLPKRTAVLGYARNDWSDDEFRRRMGEAVKEACDYDREVWDGLAPRLHYVAGEFESGPDAGYGLLRTCLERVRREHELSGNVLFHLATPPRFFADIVERLEAARLARSDDGWRRVVIEKPFGEDLASARRLDRRIRAVFTEEEIYRIDHFLGKETVQNMLVFRFANPFFEPIWNRNYVDHVQITVSEDIGIGTRAGFYETIGVVRDMVQNHLLQLLCIAAIEPPSRYDGAALRDEMAKVLSAIPPIDVWRDAVRGQYGPGSIAGAGVAGYRGEDGVAATSVTPTFAALRLRVDNWRWSGVPFYLRTGKRMREALTEVAIHFKPTPHLMFARPPDELHHNVLAFRLQPHEGIVQTFAVKEPGPVLRIRDARSTFLYSDAFGSGRLPRAYAWLLLDAMQGDQTLFARADWIDRAWAIVDPLIEQWARTAPRDFPNYAAGSWGPDGASELLEREGRRWRVI